MGKYVLQTDSTKRKNLKLFRDSSLLKYSIGSVSGLNFTVNDETNFCDWTVPYLVIAFPLPFKFTSRLSQIIFQCFFVISHQAAGRAISKRRVNISNGISFSTNWPFAERSSGIMTFNRRIRFSNESSSATSPGTSSLVATHTCTSSSHSALMKKGFLTMGSIPYQMLKGDNGTLFRCCIGKLMDGDDFMRFPIRFHSESLKLEEELYSFKYGSILVSG